MGRTKSEKAGVLFPVARIWRNMKKSKLMRVRRITAGAAVYTAAVLEYLTSEIAEIAGDFAKKDKKKLLHPRSIMFAIANDVELHQTLRSVTIPFSGVVPKVNPSLCPTLSKQSLARPKRAVQPSRSSYRSVVKPVNIAVLSQRVFGHRTKLCVIQGDITKIKADAVVHPTDHSLSFSGMVGSALSQKGGQRMLNEMQEKLKEIGGLQSTQACMTRAFGIQASFIMHCNGPSWNAAGDAAVAKLNHTIQHCLELAEKEGCSSIAFPSVGSGNAGFPKQTAAQNILSTIKTYCDANASTTKLKTVYFVLYDPQSIQIYTAELGRL